MQQARGHSATGDWRTKQTNRTPCSLHHTSASSARFFTGQKRVSSNPSAVLTNREDLSRPMDLADSKQQASRMLAVRRQDDTVVRKPSYEGPIVWECDVP